MSTTWSDSTNAIAAVASAVAAIAAGFVAVRANTAADRSNEAADTANEAAASANRTAEAVARIEHDRWHHEITPNFDITLTEEGSGHGRLIVHLDGPGALGTLDEVSIKVGDDDMDHTVLNQAGGPTQEEVDAHVWGPWRFTPSTDHADQHGRGVPAVPMVVGRGRPYSLERTRRGYWMRGMTDEQWQRRYTGQPIRLIFTCRRGNEEWVIARRVENPPIPEV